jgi:sporulation protein YlmC with PRC-barrel domain
VEEGPPSSYLLLETGTPVLASDGSEVGTVAEVRADEEEDIFDGVIVSTRHGRRYASADQVDHIAERAVRLALGPGEVAELPERP